MNIPLGIVASSKYASLRGLWRVKNEASVFRRWPVIWAYSPSKNHPLDRWLRFFDFCKFLLYNKITYTESGNNMLNAKIFYIFLFLIVVETTGLLLLKRGLEMGYLDTEAIILAVFSFAFYNLCSFGWVYFTIKNNKNK